MSWFEEKENKREKICLIPTFISANDANDINMAPIIKVYCSKFMYIGLIKRNA